MLDSYFFIPANRIDFMQKMHLLNPDYFIFDMEDSVPSSDYDKAISNLKIYANFDEHYIRANLWNYKKMDLNLIRMLAEIGFKNFVLPKLYSVDQLRKILKIKGVEKVILLVETPQLFLHLQGVMQELNAFVEAIGFGGQDFATYTNMKSNLYQMNHVRFHLNVIASQYQKKFIDTASMIIDDKKEFEEECINAFDYGCSGKFLIHPKQLVVLKNAKYFTNEEIEWGKKALEELGDVPFDQIKAYKIQGKVVEKPHFKKIQMIKNYLESK